MAELDRWARSVATRLYAVARGPRSIGYRVAIGITGDDHRGTPSSDHDPLTKVAPRAVTRFDDDIADQLFREAENVL